MTTSRAPGHQLNLEIFVVKQLDAIEAQASGRAPALVQLRFGCRQLKELLRDESFGKEDSHVSLPFSDDVTQALLSVIRGALETGSPKMVEPALAVLHKLIAYAYLQGETRASGRLDDVENVVTQVVMMTVRCVQKSSPGVQLSVVKALLTLATAEHFLAHGDCLMMAVRAVFNVAVSGSTEQLKSTARSALLQMMNTIVKRVAHQIIVSLVPSLRLMSSSGWDGRSALP